MKLERIARGYSIVEGPLWDDSTASLMFCDGFNGGVWSLDGAGKCRLIIPKRRCSGMALHVAGGVVVSGRNVGWKNGDAAARLLELDPAWGMKFFNDLGTGLDGRVYVGSIDIDFADPDRAPRLGYIHVIDLDGSSRIVGDGIGAANGLAVSPDGRQLYFNDTHYRRVRRYEVRTNGDLKEKEPLIEYSMPGDQPDGMAVAADGSVWVALAGSGCIAIVEMDGRERSRFDVPGHHVTSLCFGGADLRTVYVTTFHKTEGGEPDGSIFRGRSEISGAPAPLARVALPVT